MYRSKNIDYMNQLKSQINQLTFNADVHETFQDVWEHFKKYIVVDDLNTFLIAQNAINEIDHLPQYIYNGNLSPDFMFVTTSENKDEIDILNSIISKANITSYYRTSYTKHSNFLYYKMNPHLSQVIKNEINIVKPKVVIFFGLNICNWSIGGTERHTPFVFKNTNIMATSSLVDLLSNESSEQQKLTLKHYIWNDITKFITE